MNFLAGLPLFASVLFSIKAQTAKSAGFVLSNCLTKTGSICITRHHEHAPNMFIVHQLQVCLFSHQSYSQKSLNREKCRFCFTKLFHKNRQHLYKPGPFARLSPNVDETQECTIFQVCAFCIDKHCAPFTTLRQSAKLAVLLDITKNVD